MITRINPSIPVRTPKGNGYAHFLQDLGEEHDYLWTVFQDTGEIWTWRNKEIRARENVTLGRYACPGSQKSKEDLEEALESLENAIQEFLDEREDFSGGCFTG